MPANAINGANARELYKRSTAAIKKDIADPSTSRHVSYSDMGDGLTAALPAPDLAAAFKPGDIAKTVVPFTDDAPVTATIDQHSLVGNERTQNSIGITYQQGEHQLHVALNYQPLGGGVSHLRVDTQESMGNQQLGVLTMGLND